MAYTQENDNLFRLSSGLEITVAPKGMKPYSKVSVQLVGDPLRAEIARTYAKDVQMIWWGCFEGLVSHGEAKEISEIVNEMFTNA